MTNLQLVTSLYRDLLLREPDEEGLSYWVDAQNNGEIDTLGIAEEFLASDEFKDFIQPIVELYSTHLLRPADPEGLAYWASEYRSGVALQDIANNFKNSVEFTETLANKDHASWLTQLYNGVLNRNPDADGASYWMNMLDAGLTHAEVVEELINSDEGIEQQPARTLTSLLSRFTDTADSDTASLLNQYIEQLESEAPEQPGLEQPEPEQPEPEQPEPEQPEPEQPEPEQPELEPTPKPDFSLGERYYQGASDASAAIAIDGRLMLVADDEDQILRLFDREAGGTPLLEADLNEALGLNDTQEVDLEAVATYQDKQYWVGSHESGQRSMIFSTEITGDSADTFNINVTGQFTDLAEQLTNWDASNGHGLGENALKLELGINVEGAVFIDDTLYLGLRAPLDDGFAQLLPVTNTIDLVNGSVAQASFGEPLRLDLDGRAVRAIEQADDEGYLILAGPVDDGDEAGFGLYFWDGHHAVREIEGIDLNTIPNALTAKPEALFDVKMSDAGISASVLFDSGTVDWFDDGRASKDLPDSQQQFIGTDIAFAALPDMAPRPGDIAVTAVSGSEKEFQFVVLHGIAEGAEITFTDSGWTGDGFRANEGAVKWTAPAGGVAPGTVISHTQNADQFSDANSAAVGNGSFNLAVGGDQVIAFVGEDTDPTFIYAIQTNSSEWQETATNSNNSALPPGLENGTTAIAVGSARNAAFTADGYGTADALLAAIGNPDNWTFEHSALPDNATTAFRIGTMEAPYVPGESDIGLAITEIWPGQAGADITEDWFEITNRSGDTLDFTESPLYYDDDSANPQDAVLIEGLTTLAPGESAIVIVDGGIDAVAQFREAWSNMSNIDSLNIGFADNAAGLGSGGDAVTLWQGDPRIDGNKVAFEAYPDTSKNDAASWNVDRQAFTQADEEGAASSSAAGGDNGDMPALASPGVAIKPEPEITLISTVQGEGGTSALDGENVTLEAIVTMVTPGMDGFFLQEEDEDNDDNPLTSEGIFVYTGSGSSAWLEQLAAGDQIRISGNVSEYFEKTQLTADQSSLNILAREQPLPQSKVIKLPFGNKQGLEAFEGMRIAIEALDGQPLVVTELYELGRYGEVTLSAGGRLEQFSEVNAPSVEGYSDWLKDAEARTIKIDDANTAQNPDPIIYGRNGEELSATNPLRGGDMLDTLEGILDFSFGEWKVQNVDSLDFYGPERPATPDVDALGDAEIKVASFNVLNYFNTLDENGNKTTTIDGTEHSPRGANSADEFARQEAKIVNAINTSGADVVGLMEVENNGFGEDSAIAALVNALNADAQMKGLDGITWAYSTPKDTEGNIVSPGSDAIAVGVIYNSQAVSPKGDAVTKTDGAFSMANRAPVMQTFEDENGEQFSVVVNHFKSKGSVVNGEADIGDGQGNNNPTRVEAAKELLAWLESNPTGSDDQDVLILGDLNAYAMEDPITALKDAGFELLDDDYSYVFDGFWGSLDHALASESLAKQVTGTTTWHINSDEATALDYNTEYTTERQVENLYAPDPFRSSDHDPILVGLNLSAAEI
ncbi:ExeM/NucH family extracellular endonuclease [Halomonas colorata]|uniref:ExeM/NucH family extracellular endonuclease n=2 Tax=Halomonas TaxID=2745 RepID=UPI001867F000|nr:ExeM/NucH family extracellular endonuclease [Halomonas colorata]